MDPFETKLRKLVFSQQAKIDALYAMLAGNVSIVAKKVTPGQNPFKNNLAAKRKIEAAIAEFNRQLEILINVETRLAWRMANRRADELAQSYLRGMDLPKGMRNEYFNPSWGAYRAFQQRRTAGLNLSDRVWKVGNGNRQLINMYLGAGIQQGKSAAKISQDIREYLKEPNMRFNRVKDPKTGKLGLSQPAKNYNPGRGVYRSSYKNAMRVARTEVNMAYRQADFVRRQRMDFIIGYRVHLSPSHPKLDICDYMVGDYPKNFRFGGWHPHCICYTTSIQMPKGDFKKYLSGETEVLKGAQKRYMPKTAELYVAKNSDTFQRYTNPPYFLTDNFEFKDGYYRVKQGVAYKRNLGEVTHPKKITHAVPVEDEFNMTAQEREEYYNFIKDNRSTDGRFAYGIMSRIEGKEAARRGGFITEGLLDARGEGIVQTYTSGVLYDAMNYRLRTHGYKSMVNHYKNKAADIEGRVLSAYTKLLNNELNKLPDYKGTVYRGVRSIKPDQLQRYLDAYKNGTVITEEYFASTSLASDMAFSGELRMTIKTKSGKVIQHLSEFSSEREVLLTPGRKYKVTFAETRGSRTNIMMEEI